MAPPALRPFGRDTGSVFFAVGLVSALSQLVSEGFDSQRLEDAYDLLAEVAEQYAADLQLIVVDNNIPGRANEWVRLRLEEDDRLVRGSTAAAELDGV